MSNFLYDEPLLRKFLSSCKVAIKLTDTNYTKFQ